MVKSLESDRTPMTHEAEHPHLDAIRKEFRRHKFAYMFGGCVIGAVATPVAGASGAGWSAVTSNNQEEVTVMAEDGEKSTYWFSSPKKDASEKEGTTGGFCWQCDNAPSRSEASPQSSLDYGGWTVILPLTTSPLSAGLTGSLLRMGTRASLLLSQTNRMARLSTALVALTLTCTTKTTGDGMMRLWVGLYTVELSERSSNTRLNGKFDNRRKRSSFYFMH